jgi:hypothetical protein
MPKLCPKILVEGTRLTGKTDLVFALSEHPSLVGRPKYRYHTPIVSAEWSGFTNEPWGRGPINFAPDEEPRAIETYHTWLRLFELQPHYAWFIDRFHLSTRVWQERRGGAAPARPLSPALDAALRDADARLAAVGFLLVVCTRREDTFEDARARRLLVSGKPDQYDDLSIFIDEQRRLVDHARAGTLPRFELDMTDLDTASAAEQVVRWWQALQARPATPD